MNHPLKIVCLCGKTADVIEVMGWEKGPPPAAAVRLSSGCVLKIQVPVESIFPKIRLGRPEIGKALCRGEK